MADTPWLNVFDTNRPQLPALVAQITISDGNLIVQAYDPNRAIVLATTKIPLPALRRFLAETI